MFVLYLFEVFVMGMFLKYLFYGLIAFSVCWFGYKIYHHGKAMYILNRINEVEKIEFIKPIRKYKTVYEETGYSYNGRYCTTHYKAKRVPKHLVYKGIAFFKNGITLKFQITENSKIYSKLIDI